MENLNINKILMREKDASQIKAILMDFEAQKDNPLFKKGIYVYGEPGTGKTTFVMNILKEMGYDVIRYDAGDIRNKSIIDTITKHNMSDKNIMSMFHKKIKKIAIVMDEIDGMNNGDKGGINALIKLIRPKKTKKQKTEDATFIPIVCIGNYHMDKKIKELMKVCNTFDLKVPSTLQITGLIHTLAPSLGTMQIENILRFVHFDLRKLKTIIRIYTQKEHILSNDLIQHILQVKTYNDDTKVITQKLINQPYKMVDHLSIMNETDRTIVGLLWHENIIDVLGKMDKSISIPFYLKQLNNMCFADYIDRITFQKQIWQFNEMSSLIKTFQNNKLYHETFSKKQKFNPVEVRFTKVLTKYSTEYNNSLFIQSLCQQLGMDRKDLLAFFTKNKSFNHTDMENITLFENYEITKLDINRIYRYLDRYGKDDVIDESDDKSVCIESE
jgi:DNA polymerase III delta prime subunit